MLNELQFIYLFIYFRDNFCNAIPSTKGDNNN